MRLPSALSVVCAATVGLGALASAPAMADPVTTPPGGVASAQVSIAMDNDWQFIDSECLFIPILVTYGRADDTSIVGETRVTKVDSVDTANDGTFLVLPGDPVSAQLLDEVFVCPADGTGQFTLNTTIRAIEPAIEDSFSLDALTFWVRPAASTVSGLRAMTVKGGTRVRGRVLAGEGEATGIMEIRYRLPGKKRWSKPEVAPIADGVFAYVTDRMLPRGTRVRATLTRCSWCSRASASTVVR